MKGHTIPFGPKVVFTKSAIAMAPMNDACKKQFNYEINFLKHRICMEEYLNMKDSYNTKEAN